MYDYDFFFPRIRYVEHFNTDPRQVIEAACRLGLEGVVSKRVDSLYKGGRQESWVKSKCRLTDNFPIIAKASGVCPLMIFGQPLSTVRRQARILIDVHPTFP